MGQQTHLVINLGGGLNLVDTHYTLQQQPGSARELINYEASISGGYRRINGYTKHCTVRPSDFVSDDCAAPNYFDDSYWVNNTGMTWTGTVWQMSGSASVGIIDDVGTWATSFRPTSMAIAFYIPSGSGSTTLNVYLRDTNGDTIATADYTGYALDTVHTDTLAITFGSYDIADVRITDGTYRQPELRCINFT